MGKEVGTDRGACRRGMISSSSCGRRASGGAVRPSACVRDDKSTRHRSATAGAHRGRRHGEGTARGVGKEERRRGQDAPVRGVLVQAALDHLLERARVLVHAALAVQGRRRALHPAANHAAGQDRSSIGSSRVHTSSRAPHRTAPAPKASTAQAPHAPAPAPNGADARVHGSARR